MDERVRSNLWLFPVVHICFAFCKYVICSVCENRPCFNFLFIRLKLTLKSSGILKCLCFPSNGKNHMIVNKSRNWIQVELQISHHKRWLGSGECPTPPDHSMQNRTQSPMC
uniref:Uncharacterized protein n=1 Tax=Anguilla anguilla TaxID=7936 RepID=A0A0E9WQX0_ANGAN